MHWAVLTPCQAVLWLLSNWAVQPFALRGCRGVALLLGHPLMAGYGMAGSAHLVPPTNSHSSAAMVWPGHL